MATLFTNQSATPIELVNTTGARVMAGALGGSAVLNPEPVSTEVISVFVGSGQASVATGAAPTSSDAPALSGDPQATVELTATDGTWAGTATITYARQWQYSEDDGETWVDVDEATASAYTPTIEDVGRVLRFRVTATNAYGTAVAYSSESAPVGTAP